MHTQQTIVAISTPMGIGAMSVVRMSGDLSLSILQRLTRKQDFEDHFATLCNIFDQEGQIIDEAIVIFFKNPKSYTREDVCEIQCHGGVVLAKMILSLCVEYGARLANPGEFTKRALLNGRIDLSQVEAISHLIQTQNTNAVRLLAKQLKGSLSDFVQQSRESLLRALAHSEVMIDYSDEDIPQDLITSLIGDISQLQNRLEEILDFSKMRNVLLENYELSIVGKPNVGKSSLLNALLMQERAIVSDQAGTTRDTIEGSINIEGNIIKIIDTAGIRESEDEIENMGIQRSKKAMQESDIILAVFDSSRELDTQDQEIIQYLQQLQGKDLIILNNKNDLNSKLELKMLKEKIQAKYFLDINTKDNKFVLEIKNILAEIFRDKQGIKEDILLSAQYQTKAVEETIFALKQSKKVLQNNELELFSYHIKEAIEQLSLLVKPYSIDEMFDKMFGEFCLGK
ncbi:MULTISPECIES: tRNA uridine-5-carboxymethylaminomethyl(34) synthesis GTPase MnmE [unclassified Helicobacter]|uniref:tRNA uridine-5-carboxymethylaminomethyl(34) synthesis GTPase MnmE n=1 Tax=unclassified Helicobacter TaxID=2593540 RepID=UPI000CF0EC9F|nr:MULTISPECIES: tRNA uridine-5-carboxymethylaminomethyl(34) synthesis GTPase MnmE [unclassified Helicobacter]